MRNKKWSLETKHGLPESVVEGKFMFWIRTLICRGQKNKILSKKEQKMQNQTFGVCFFREIIKYIQVGIFDQKYLF